MLRRLALEYLESNLSGQIVAQISRLLEPGSPTSGQRSREQVLDELMASQPRILLSLGIRSADASG